MDYNGIKLLPELKSVTPTHEEFRYNTGCNVALIGTHDFRVVSLAEKLCSTIEEKTEQLCILYSGTTSAMKKKIITISCFDKATGEGYTLIVSQNEIKLEGDTPAGCFYGIQTLIQMLTLTDGALPTAIIRDEPDMSYRGFYHDITRGRIPTLDSMKQLVERMASYKLNALQLYVEHTFSFAEFGVRSVGSFWTAKEMLELDEYCYKHFITFQPSLATFGHLYELLSLPQYKRLCELEDYRDETHFWYERMAHHTINPNDPESIKTVYSLIDQYLPLFRSKHFNICCDETFDNVILIYT